MNWIGLKHKVKVFFLGRNQPYGDQIKQCPGCWDFDKVRELASAPGFTPCRCSRCNEDYFG